MGRASTLSDTEIELINHLFDQNKSIRMIVAETGITKAKVAGVIAKRNGQERQGKIAALITEPTVAEARKSVFDIMERLEDCLDEIEDLKNARGRLGDRVAVRTEKRMLIAEARQTLESIYNIRVLNDFIAEVTAILEEQSPGTRRRIFERLEASTGASAAISLFAANSGR